MCNDAYHVSGATRWMRSVMQTRVRKTEDLSNWFSVSHATYLCLFAGFWSCSPFKWVVWVPQSGCFCPPSLLLLLPSASRAKTSGGMMPLQKEPVNACPTCQAKYLSLGVPPYLLLLLFALLPLLLLLSYPHPRILENRKCILLSDGWAPCSCWEERKKNLSFPPGQSDEFSSLKAEGRLCFLGAPWNPWSLSAWKPRALLHYVCGEN